MTNKADYIKSIPNSTAAYAQLKPITDAAQAGELKPWSPAIIDLLATYKVNVQRLKDIKAQANLSFPTSIIDHRSMAIGFRYAKDDGSFAEDLFVFVEDVGLTCYYRGSQEEALPEYAGSHHATIVLSEVLPDFQRQLAAMQQQIDVVGDQARQSSPPPEISLVFNGQANNNRLDIRLVGVGQTLVAESISVNGVGTPLNQQFSRLYPIPNVNIPDDIFDRPQGEIMLVIRYRTLDNRRYEFIQAGEQQLRAGDGRYNVVLISPPTIKPADN